MAALKSGIDALSVRHAFTTLPHARPFDMASNFVSFRENYTTTLENEVRRLQKEKDWYQAQLQQRTGSTARPSRYGSDPTMPQ